MVKRNKVYMVTQEGSHLHGKHGKFLGMVGYGNEQKLVRLEIDDEVRDWHPDNVKEVETLDLTPSWPDVLNIYLAVLDNKKASRDGRQAALDGLRQMAQVAQMYVDLSNKGLPAAVQLEKADLGQYGDKYAVKIKFPDGQGITVQIEEHDFLRYKKLYNDEPERTGQFKRNELYTS